MRFETNDQFLDRLEMERLKYEGYDFTSLDREFRKDPFIRKGMIKSIEELIEAL